MNPFHLKTRKLSLSAALLSMPLFLAGAARVAAESPHAALLEGCRRGDAALVQAALGAGANVSFQNPLVTGGAETPLGLALQNGHLKVATLLSTQGAEAWPAVKNPADTPGCLAAKFSPQMLPQLLNELPKDVPLPLLEHLAETLASRGQTELVKRLADVGLRSDHITARGGTPFLWALAAGHMDAAQELLDWAAPRLLRRFDKNLDAELLIRSLAARPWNEPAAVAMMGKMFSIGVQFEVKEGSTEPTPAALANKFRLGKLAKRFGWTSAIPTALSTADMAVLAALEPDMRLAEEFFQRALDENEAPQPLASRILAQYFANSAPFRPAEAARWLERGAQLDGLVEIPWIGKTTASNGALRAQISGADRSARLQWLRHKGANLFKDLTLTDDHSPAALKLLYQWGGQPTDKENEVMLAKLILWHSEDKHWNANLRGVLQFLISQKAVLGKSQLSQDALSCLARRPEPRLLAAVDTSKLQQKVIATYRAKKSSKIPGQYRSHLGDGATTLVLEKDGSALLEQAGNTIFASWMEDEDQVAVLGTPDRTYYLSLNAQGVLELRANKFQRKADMELAVVAQQEVPTEDAPSASRLRTVQYRNQGLTTAPAEEPFWQSAQLADFSGNRLRSLPNGIFQPSLVELVASENWLTSLELPKTLTQLHRVNFAGNGFDHQLPWLNKCPNLQELNLSENRLTRFPGPLSRLAELAVLDLSGNRVSSIPQDLQDDLPNLKRLVLARNRIRSLSPAILQWNLDLLDLRDNQLDYETLRGPIQVKQMLISGNQFTTNQLESLLRRYPHVQWSQVSQESASVLAAK